MIIIEFVAFMDDLKETDKKMDELKYINVSLAIYLIDNKMKKLIKWTELHLCLQGTIAKKRIRIATRKGKMQCDVGGFGRSK